MRYIVMFLPSKARYASSRPAFYHFEADETAASLKRRKAGAQNGRKAREKGKKSWQKVGEKVAGFRKNLYLCNAFKRRP